MVLFKYFFPPLARLGYPPSAAVGDTAHFLPAPRPQGMMAGQEEGASGRLRTVLGSLASLVIKLT